MFDAIIVGAGLFGSIIQKALDSVGMTCVVIDDKQPHAGSKPAACLMKPSWFSSLGKEVYEPSLKLLDQLYGVRDIQFKVGPGSATVHWIPPNLILSDLFVTGKVTGFDFATNSVLLADGRRYSGRNIIVAAGVWSDKLLSIPKLSGRAGAAFTWQGKLEQPFISPWAPYRQLVGFNRAPGEVWVGDGSAIKPENWNSERQQKSLDRCAGKVPHLQKEKARTLFGIRPYTAAMKPCYYEKLSPGLFVATGGAKNGTLAAGWCAYKILEELS